jgi:hypothetical protein
MRLVRLLARRVGATNLASEEGLAIVKLDGFSNWVSVRPFKWLVDELLEGALQVWILLDRDYRTDESIATIKADLKAINVEGHVWARKELESYLLEVALIARVSSLGEDETVQLLLEATDPLRNIVHSRLFAEILRVNPTAKESFETGMEKFTDEFDKCWARLSWRLHRCPAKDVISNANQRLQQRGHRTISARNLASRMRAPELSSEMSSTLRKISLAATLD